MISLRSIFSCFIPSPTPILLWARFVAGHLTGMGQPPSQDPPCRHSTASLAPGRTNTTLFSMGASSGGPHPICVSVGSPMEGTHGAMGGTLEGILAANMLRDPGQDTSLAGPQCSHLKREFHLPQGPPRSQKTKNPVSGVRPEPGAPGKSCLFPHNPHPTPVSAPSSCQLGQIHLHIWLEEGATHI